MWNEQIKYVTNSWHQNRATKMHSRLLIPWGRILAYKSKVKSCTPAALGFVVVWNRIYTTFSSTAMSLSFNQFNINSFILKFELWSIFVNDWRNEMQYQYALHHKWNCIQRSPIYSFWNFSEMKSNPWDGGGLTMQKYLLEGLDVIFGSRLPTKFWTVYWNWKRIT